MDNKLLFIKNTFVELNLERLRYKDCNFEIEIDRGNNNKNIIENKNIDIDKISEENLNIEKEYFKVKSPLVGLFYSKPSPEEDSFVKVGQEVKKGDILCVLEAMKMFNEVKSPIDGIIKKINFDDEKLVSVDDVLFEIEEHYV